MPGVGIVEAMDPDQTTTNSPPDTAPPETDPDRASWRSQVHFYLDDTETPTGRVVNGAIATLILLSAMIFAIETFPLPESLTLVLHGLDWFILSSFTLEYLVRLWAAERPWHYIFSFYGLIDLVAILPFLLGFLDIRFIRLLRWLRILRLIRFFNDQLLFGRITGADTLIVLRILFTLATIVFIYSGLIFQVEHLQNPEVFRNFLDAVYFAVVTMTTVGYGDVTPVSEAGRALTLMMILTGVALIPTQVGNLIRQVTKVADSVQNPCQQCGLLIHDADARYCKRCGRELGNGGIGG